MIMRKANLIVKIAFWVEIWFLIMWNILFAVPVLMLFMQQLLALDIHVHVVYNTLLYSVIEAQRVKFPSRDFEPYLRFKIDLQWALLLNYFVC